MRHLLKITFLFYLVSTTNALSAQAQPYTIPDRADAIWSTHAQEYLKTSEYYFQRQPDGIFAAANRKQQAGFFVNGGRLTVKPVLYGSPGKDQRWSVSIELLSVAGVSRLNKEKNTVAVQQQQLSYNYEDFKIEYQNDEMGLRQNFIVHSKPADGQPLSVSLKITGDLVPRILNNHTLAFEHKHLHKAVLKYDGLAVWDAHHTPLKAHMELKGKRLHIVVEDANAVYPVTIDPLSHSAEWTASADALLPGLLNNFQLQVNALVGYSVIGLGDVNGDGYDDVAIGAPGAIDILSGPSTVVGAGAVFVYFGSDTGLSATPSKVLRATTPVTNALFGFCVTSGNVTGDDKMDIIVSAPGESYTTSVSGTPATATVTAGKVYVFSGEDLAAAGNPSPALSVYLNGSGFFSRGILGLLAANISVNALFGFSLAVADDIDGDGLGEIVVGAPGYASLQLISVKSGAAFVYFSKTLASNTPVQLTAPSSGLLGITNLDGLLFGFSVDGAGDYNQDGIPDIVVSAPAGVSILTNFLGGSAYVYYGNSSGSINANIGTQLTAGGGLLATTANLFGYKAMGVRDAAGHRNGNILVSAPTGGLLSNLLGGLRLKAGTLSVFVANSSPGSSQTPTQSLSSPRSSSLLSVLSGQNINVSALFGASMDNMGDANCDGNSDIIIGEPLSTSVGLIGADVVGGGAYVFQGNADGTYATTPSWTLNNEVTDDLGVNTASLVGYSVTGAGHIYGPYQPTRVLVGAPGQALDFGSGLLNLGSTLGTLYSFTSTNDNVGKAYEYPTISCLVLGVKVTDLKAVVQDCNVSLQWQMPPQNNLDHIEIEQSNDQHTFTTVQQTGIALSGAYSVQVPQANAVSYYRLKIIDNTGNANYSSMVNAVISCVASNKIEVYPNPVQPASSVSFNSMENGQANLTITDVYGRRMRTARVIIIAGANRLNLDCSGLAGGQYYVQLSGSDWKSNTVKIVKVE